MPDFSTPAAIFARAVQLFDDDEARVRRAWEKKYAAPSDGNAAFEGLPLEEHSARLLCDRFLAQGYPDAAPVTHGADDMSRRIAEAAAKGQNPFAALESEYEDALADDDDGDED